MEKNTKEKFERLFGESKPKLLNVAYNVVNNYDVAEDVLQDSYIKAWNNFDEYDSDKKFLNWMTTIVRNTGIDALRTKKRPLASAVTITRDARETGNASSKADVDFIDHTCDLEKQLMQQETLSEIYGLITDLPADLSEIMKLMFAGQTYQEIADDIDIPLSTVRAKVHRAKKILRKTAKSLNIINF